MAFWLKLIGRHPDQIKARERFDRALQELDEKDKELDKLLCEIRETDKAIQSGNTAALNSLHPPRGTDEKG